MICVVIDRLFDEVCVRGRVDQHVNHHPEYLGLHRRHLLLGTYRHSFTRLWIISLLPRRKIGVQSLIRIALWDLNDFHRFSRFPLFWLFWFPQKFVLENLLGRFSNSLFRLFYLMEESEQSANRLPFLCGLYSLWLVFTSHCLELLFVGKDGIIILIQYFRRKLGRWAGRSNIAISTLRGVVHLFPIHREPAIIIALIIPIRTRGWHRIVIDIFTHVLVADDIISKHVLF